MSHGLSDSESCKGYGKLGTNRSYALQDVAIAILSSVMKPVRDTLTSHHAACPQSGGRKRRADASLSSLLSLKIVNCTSDPLLTAAYLKQRPPSSPLRVEIKSSL